MRNKILYIALIFYSANVSAQGYPKTMKNSDDLGSILGSKDNTIHKATVQAETEKTLSVQVEFKGFADKKKAYKIKGTILTAKKTKVEEIEPVEVDLDPKAGLADLFFTFKQKQGKNYNAAHLETGVVQFTVIDKNSATAQTGGGLKEFGLGSKTFTFEYKKKWKLKGATGQEITVKLVPFKSAASIKQ
jgi:hypothetical protein